MFARERAAQTRARRGGVNRPIRVLAPCGRDAHGGRMSKPARRIVIVGFDECQALDVIGPLEVFAGAREAQARRGARDPGYAPVLASAGPGRAIRTASGVRLVADATLEQ